MSRLRRLTPSALDAEVRLLAPSREELMEVFAAIDRGDGEDTPLSTNPYARLSAFLRLLLNRWGVFRIVSFLASFKILLPVAQFWLSMLTKDLNCSLPYLKLVYLRFTLSCFYAKAGLVNINGIDTIFGKLVIEMSNVKRLLVGWS